MSIWNSYITLLEKLQVFNRAGSICWSLFPLLILGVTSLKTYMNGLDIMSSKAVMAISYSYMIVFIGFVVVIPQCMASFKNYINGDYEIMRMLPGDEVVTSNMLPPSKLIWIAFIDCLILAILSVITDSVMMTSVMVYFFASIYLPMLGVLFGCLTKTFSNECKAIGNVIRKNSFEKASDLLLQYKVLKRASQLCMLTVAGACTFLAIISAYYLMLVMAYSCFGYAKKTIFFLISGFQVKMFVVYLSFFANSAHECSESFKGISEQLR